MHVETRELPLVVEAIGRLTPQREVTLGLVEEDQVEVAFRLPEKRPPVRDDRAAGKTEPAPRDLNHHGVDLHCPAIDAVGREQSRRQSRAQSDTGSASRRERLGSGVEQRLPGAAPFGFALNLLAGRGDVELDPARDLLAPQHVGRRGDVRVDVRGD